MFTDRCGLLVGICSADAQGEIGEIAPSSRLVPDIDRSFQQILLVGENSIHEFALMTGAGVARESADFMAVAIACDATSTPAGIIASFAVDDIARTDSLKLRSGVSPVS